MANRLFNQFRLSLEKKVVSLYADVTFGAAGAPTVVVANSKGIKTVTRTSQGLFVITLQDTYRKLLTITPTFKLAAASFPAAPGFQVTATALTTLAAPTITVQFNNAAGTTATDPASGEEVLFEINLSDSSAP